MNIEEAIEILNNSIKTSNRFFEQFGEYACIDKYVQEAIETVLADREKLIEENKKLEEARNWYFEHTVNKAVTPEMLHKILRQDYIPKSVIKEKIEEVQKEYNKLDKQVDEYINDANKNLSKYYENKERIGTIQTLAWVIDNLQELLEGRK